MVDVELRGRLWFAAHLSGMDPDDFVPAEGEEAKRALSDLKVDPFKIWYVGGQRQNDSLERRAMLSQFRRQQRDHARPAGDAAGAAGAGARIGRMAPRAPADHHAALHAGFRWQVPEFFNIAEVCCARWARDTPAAVAIRYEHEDGRCAEFSYRDLQANADRLSSALARFCASSARPVSPLPRARRAACCSTSSTSCAASRRGIQCWRCISAPPRRTPIAPGRFPSDHYFVSARLEWK